MMIAAFLALQLALVLEPRGDGTFIVKDQQGHVAGSAEPGRDNVLIWRNKSRNITGLIDSNGKVLGTWDRGQNFVVEKPLCEFKYSEELETRALSLLGEEFGSETALQYDAKTPAITLYRTHAELDFMGILPDSRGSRLLDPPSFTIDVDVCSHSINKHYLVSPY